MSTCKACQDTLVLQLDPEDSGDEIDTVPDDLELQCGCHFHWQCLLDQSGEVGVSLRCPSCNSYLPSNQPGPSTTNAFLATPQGIAILARYSNEGGVEEGLDILPAITEEAFLVNNPEARHARAMHLMAAEGDVTGIVDLLRDAEQPNREDEEPHMNAKQLLLWGDPLNGRKSLIHLAIANKQEEVFWLALWLSSGVPQQFFPDAAVQVAQALGLHRLPVSAAEDDVRFLQDESGSKAEDICQQVGPPWADYVSKGLFSIS